MSKIGPDTKLITLQRIVVESVHRDWGRLVNNVRQSMAGEEFPPLGESPLADNQSSASANLK